MKSGAQRKKRGRACEKKEGAWEVLRGVLLCNPVSPARAPVRTGSPHANGARAKARALARAAVLRAASRESLRHTGCVSFEQFYCANARGAH